MDRLIEFLGNHPFLTLAFVAILGLLVGNELLRFTRKYKELGPSAIVPVMNRDDAVVIDVREPNEYREGHLANAELIPLGELNQKLDKLAKHKDQPVVVYCRSGNRSARACRMLAKHGFEDLYNLAGGILAWENEKLPVKRK